jgi:hypothetical protein
MRDTPPRFAQVLINGLTGEVDAPNFAADHFNLLVRTPPQAVSAYDSTFPVIVRVLSLLPALD